MQEPPSNYTGQEWRRVGSEEWRDNLAGLENTDSTEFKEALKKEDAIWNSAIRKNSNAVQKWKTLFQKYQSAAYPETIDYAFICCKWQNRIIHLQPGSTGYTYNAWITDSKNHTLWSRKELTDIIWDSESDIFCTLCDIGKGAEDIELRVYKFENTPKLLWKRNPVGPSIAIHQGHLYYLGIENALRSHQLWSVSLLTGKNASCLYDEKDKRIQLTLQHKNSDLFLHAANALYQRYAIISSNQVHWKIPFQKSTIVPISLALYASNRGLHNLTTKNTILFPDGEFIENALPGPDSSLFVTTVKDGKTTLWYKSGVKSHNWIPLLQPNCISEIDIVHFPTEFPTFILKQPHSPNTVYEFKNSLGLAMLQTCKFPEPLVLTTLVEGLAGPEKVPYYVVSATPNPKKLLVCAYGAYGISAIRYYPIRWLAYLTQGYAIAHASPRGGREKGDRWYDGGRTALRKHHTFEDTASVIREVQKRLQISPSHTLFFGRSAGGWLAAQIAQTYSHLVQGVYAEVPYVDVLRTTTNPDLPLTQLEYDEFGDPLHRPADFKALKRISPVDTVPFSYKGDKRPRIIVRTGVNDMQVLPYEALKWAARLREKGWKEVFVGIDHNGGHFAAAKDMNEQRAQDAALLDGAISKAAKAATRRSGSRTISGRRTRRR